MLRQVSIGTLVLARCLTHLCLRRCAGAGVFGMGAMEIRHSSEPPRLHRVGIQSLVFLKSWLDWVGRYGQPLPACPGTTVAIGIRNGIPAPCRRSKIGHRPASVRQTGELFFDRRPQLLQRPRILNRREIPRIAPLTQRLNRTPQ